MTCKNILIRCDSSNIIGTGHVMRCLNLCEYYPNYNFTFVCRNFFMNITDKIRQHNHKHNLILLDYNIEPQLNNYRSWIGKTYNNEIFDLISIVETTKYDIVIIDHYGIDYSLEDNIRKYCDKVIVISDIFDFNHKCDIFINYNTNDLEKVKTINLNTETTYRIGVKNIILNKKFTSGIRKQNTFCNKIQNICVIMGGADPYNYTLKVLTIIDKYAKENNILINIVMGKSNNNIKIINDKARFDENSNYKILVDVNYDELINLYLENDLVIGSLSITAYERLYLNIPQICLKIVDNQLIQQLDEFNIATLDTLINKIIAYPHLYIPNTPSNTISHITTLLD